MEEARQSHYDLKQYLTLWGRRSRPGSPGDAGGFRVKLGFLAQMAATPLFILFLFFTLDIYVTLL